MGHIALIGSLVLILSIFIPIALFPDLHDPDTGSAEETAIAETA